MSTIATLHLMVGLPCSGKTTLARKLEEKYSALRLTPDEWHIRLFGQDMDDKEHDARHNLVESLLWDVAGRVLVIGADVILDFGFWARSEREDFRSRAAELGADFKIHFLEVPEEMLLERLAARNAQLPQYTFPLPNMMLREWIQSFEPPSKEELE
ncbi:AAA family ATPase [Bacillus sp. EAC]|uniref:AAA family ATPase n=1 Tax=Bacillus sp. EAC TaxID=1978338 RepID=UPI001C4F5609|nr:AAA family ATPase [Bacillus sp. EAC]